MSESIFVYGEAELAEALGVNIRNFQKKRATKLRQETDWGLNAMHVAYARHAVPVILDLVTGRAVPATELATLLEKSLIAEAQKNAAAEIKAFVSKFFLNPHLMQVTLANGATVNVKVKSRENFIFGMEVPLKQEPDSRYVIARKLPRFPGRW